MHSSDEFVELQVESYIKTVIKKKKDCAGKRCHLYSC